MSRRRERPGRARGVLLAGLLLVLVVGGSPGGAGAEDRQAVRRWLDVARRAVVLHDARQYREAAAAYREAIRIAEQADLPPKYLEAALSACAQCLGHLSAWVDLRDVHRRLLAVRERMGVKEPLLDALIDAGQLESDLANYGEARELLDRALRLAGKLEDRLAYADASNRLAAVYLATGRLAPARSAAEAAERIYEDAQDEQRLLVVRQVLGNLHLALGEPEQARAFLERALAGAQDMPVAFRTRLLLGLAEVHAELGHDAVALDHVRRARDLNAQAGDAVAAAAAALTIAALQAEEGRWLDVLASYRGVRGALREFPVMRGEAVVEAARARARLGAPRRARAGLERALAMAAKLGVPALELAARVTLARIELAAGAPAKAVPHVERALRLSAATTSGLAPSAQAFARHGLEEVFSTAVQVAFAQQDVETTHGLLDRARARTLSRALGVHASPTALPADAPQREDLARATARLAEARNRLAEARRTNSHERRREAWIAFTGARDEVRRRLESLQQEQLARLKLDEPALSDLAGVRKELPADAALAVFAFAGERLRALVVEPDAARTPDLGPAEAARQEVEQFVELLQDDSERGPERLALIRKRQSALRTHLVDGLKLREGTRTLLVSPDGVLGRLPFALLAPELTVAMVPSASFCTAWSGAQGRRGQGVLAVGSPEHDGLAEPPTSRAEVEAVTREGDVQLLGPDATETEFLREVRSRPRWRSVLFACHGLLDARYPEWSALALTPTDETDGLLTVVEILGLDVPADLAVLSACDTGLGKNVHGEGLFSLANAFLHAGAPRVIASLWKVDDSATEALVVEFYALWRPAKGEGRPAAQALAQAQAYVRSHEKWKHPYYWGGWVLWGVP